MGVFRRGWLLKPLFWDFFQFAGVFKTKIPKQTPPLFIFPSILENFKTTALEIFLDTPLEIQRDKTLLI